MSREVQTKFENVEQLEGAGVKIRRSIGTRNVYWEKKDSFNWIFKNINIFLKQNNKLRNFDPFLLLDEFKNKGKVPGFPVMLFFEKKIIFYW